MIPAKTILHGPISLPTVHSEIGIEIELGLELDRVEVSHLSPAFPGPDLVLVSLPPSRHQTKRLGSRRH